MRIAFGSSDGILVNEHFGRADTFYVFDVEDQVRPAGIRKARPFCHGGTHEDADLEEAVDSLADCARVYVLQIGRGAEEVLRERGIEPVVSRELIEEILDHCLKEQKKESV